MSKIKLTGENSGYVEISAGQNAGNNTLELPTSGTKVVASDDSGNVNNLGIVTATTFSGNLTGDVTGNLTGNVSLGAGTSISSPATNVLTLGTNSVERVRIDSSGNIGIGSAQPTAKLDVGGYSKLKGVLETVSAATTYIHNSALVLELDVQNGGTTYTYTNTGGNIGIVSFKNLPADTQNGTVITLIHTQNSSTPSGVGNTTAATGIGTNCTIIPYVGGSPIAGISTRGLVGSATTVTLSETAGDRDFVSFFVHYNGGTTSDLTSYEVYVTKNGGFRQGNIGI